LAIRELAYPRVVQLPRSRPTSVDSEGVVGAGRYQCSKPVNVGFNIFAGAKYCEERVRMSLYMSDDISQQESPATRSLLRKEARRDAAVGLPKQYYR